MSQSIFYKVSELCSQKGVTTTALEKKLGFGRGTISKWKYSSPSVVNLKKISDYFNVPIEDFLE